MRAAIYYRVSSKRQEEAETIESQRLFLPEWAKRQGWTVVAEFEDVAIPGKETEKRHGLMELLNEARRKPKPFDVVVIRDWSRLARTLNIYDQAKILGTFQDNDIRIAELHRGFVDLNDPNDLLMAQIQLWQAAKDNEIRSQAVRQGHRKVREKGGYSGKRPYGLTYEAKTMEFGIDKKKHKTLDTIFRLLTQGWGLIATARVLKGNKDKYPLPSKRSTRWWTGSISKMVHNDFYFTGVITPTNPDNLPVDTGIKMFPEKVVMDARREMGIRRRRDRKKTRKKLPTVFTDFLFTGMLRCLECGYTIGPHAQQRVRKQSLYYACRGRAQDLCPSRMYRADELEPLVWDYVIENMLLNRAKLEAAILGEEFMQDATRDELEDMVAGAENTLAELADEAKRLRRLYVKGHYDGAEAEYEAEKARIEQERAEAELTRRRTREQLERPTEVKAAITQAVQAVADEVNYLLLHEPDLHDEFNQLTEEEQGKFIVDMLVRLEVADHDPEAEKLIFHQKRNILKHLLGPKGFIWVKRFSGGIHLEVKGHIQQNRIHNTLNVNTSSGLF